MAQKITLAKNCQRDTRILLFMLAITSAFAECWRELERLLSVSYDYGLIESYIYVRVIVFIKSYVYKFVELQLL